MSANTMYLFELFFLFAFQGIKSTHLFIHQKTGKLKNIMLCKLEQKITLQLHWHEFFTKRHQALKQLSDTFRTSTKWKGYFRVLFFVCIFHCKYFCYLKKPQTPLNKNKKTQTKLKTFYENERVRSWCPWKTVDLLFFVMFMIKILVQTDLVPNRKLINHTHNCCQNCSGVYCKFR